METLGDRIKTIRGLASQMQFSSSLGIAQTKLSRYERNTTPPDLDFLVRLSRRYAVSLEWLITGEGRMRASKNGDDETAPSSPHTENTAPRGVQNPEPAASLRQELALERLERRELSAENRRLHNENAALLRENGELREKVARLEERGNRRASAGDC
ncbi:helix-turn-helix domain-containing protein [Desulfovibrio piger]|nr:helix-turn-helix domain-containing protein [Desulfovibrio piger]